MPCTSTITSSPVTPDPRKRLLRNLRRRVRVQRTFDVEALPDGRERQTCRTCGHQETVKLGPLTPQLAARFTRYRAGTGVTGICPSCSATEAQKRYPD